MHYIRSVVMEKGRDKQLLDFYNIFVASLFDSVQTASPKKPTNNLPKFSYRHYTRILFVQNFPPIGFSRNIHLSFV